MELIIDNYLIDEPIINILQKCKSQLTNGKLSNIIDKGSWVSIPCPFHSGGREQNNSCGVVSITNDKLEYGTFNCFRGETKVLTKEFGFIEMNKIINSPVHILNGNGDWEETIFHNYGKQKLMKMNLKSGNRDKVIYATPEHEWLIKDYNRKYQTQNLKSNMYLQRGVPRLKCDVELDPKGIIHGYIYGDGNMTYKHKNEDVYNYRCYFFNEVKEEIEKYFDQSKIKRRFASNNVEYDCIDFKESRNLKEVPSLNEPYNYLLGFLAGYFVADGNCFENRLSITSYKYEDLYKIKQICSILNIVTGEIRKSLIPKGTHFNSKVDKWAYSIMLSKDTIPDNFFISSKGKLAKPKYIRNRYKVINVENTNLIEDVYCCQTSTHSFVIDGYILTGNCFTCKETGKLYHLIGACFDAGDDFGKKWLISNFGKPLRERHIDLPEIELNQNKGISALNESILDNFQSYHPYMTQRKLTKDVIDRFKIKYDPKTESIIFPVWNAKGDLLFYTSRNVNFKRFNIPSKIEKPIYLLNFINDLNINKVIVCESQINTLTCWSYGYPAIGLFGSTLTTYQRDILNHSGIRTYILALDGDEAGKNGITRFKQMIRKDVFVEVVNLPPGKDINDLTQEEFTRLFKQYY